MLLKIVSVFPLPTLIGATESESIVMLPSLKVAGPNTVNVSVSAFPMVVLPSTVKLFLIVVVPVVAPNDIVVAAPKALMVVTMVLNTSNVVVPAVTATLVPKEGEALNTNDPVPTSSLITPRNSADVVAEKSLNLFDEYLTVPPDPNPTVTAPPPSEAENVMLFKQDNVFPLLIDSVEPTTAVNATPLILVAVSLLPEMELLVLVKLTFCLLMFVFRFLLQIFF